MSRYSVRFYNEISDSTGNANHVCQRELEVATGLGEDEAIALAIMEFEKLENTSSWTTHASTLECTQLPAPQDSAGSYRNVVGAGRIMTP